MTPRDIGAYITTLLVGMDGIFHLTQPLKIFMSFAPDWIISETLFGMPGFGVVLHRFMGLFLIASSIFIIIIDEDKSSFSKAYFYFIAPFTLGLIVLALWIRILGSG